MSPRSGKIIEMTEDIYEDPFLGMEDENFSIYVDNEKVGSLNFKKRSVWMTFDGEDSILALMKIMIILRYLGYEEFYVNVPPDTIDLYEEIGFQEYSTLKKKRDIVSVTMKMI